MPSLSSNINYKHIWVLAAADECAGELLHPERRHGHGISIGKHHSDDEHHRLHVAGGARVLVVR